MRDEIVAGDTEADDVEDHDEGDDGVIVYKGWSVHKPSLLVELHPKEAGKTSHVWENIVTAPI